MQLIRVVWWLYLLAKTTNARCFVLGAIPQVLDDSPLTHTFMKLYYFCYSEYCLQNTISLRLIRMGKVIQRAFSATVLGQLVGATSLCCILGYQILTVCAGPMKKWNKYVFFLAKKVAFMFRAWPTEKELFWFRFSHSYFWYCWCYMPNVPSERAW